jgi:two-component system, chemotaxis family, protein-glutamate methylesterase/glutaminase
MALRNIVVVGASAGGVRALRTLVRGLPADLQAALFVVLHTPSGEKSLLPEILSYAGAFPALAAQEGSMIENGRIYVAPNNRHMLVERGRVRVVFRPRENLFRPAIDPLFRSAASAYGARVIGILLSGTLDDGCNGLGEIKQRGGFAIVQKPSDAEFPDLPLNAIQRVNVDRVLPVAEITTLLISEVTKSVTEEEISMASAKPGRHFDGITCPDCFGPIYEEEGGSLRFRCVAGHSYSPETMRIGHAKKLENALWSAIANFEEHATILRRLAQDKEGDGLPEDAADFEDEARRQEEHASELRFFVERVNRSSMGKEAAKSE